MARMTVPTMMRIIGTQVYSALIAKSADALCTAASPAYPPNARPQPTTALPIPVPTFIPKEAAE